MTSFGASSRAVPAALLLLVVACKSAVVVPDLGGIYDRAAQQSDSLRNPIIVIPGVLGSKLYDDASETVVWGAFAGRYADPTRNAREARLVALPMAKGRALGELRDDVRPDGVLDRLRLNLLFLPIELQAYVNILRTMGVGGYRDKQLSEAGAIDYGDEHFTCFQFAYDWRRDNAENAARLHDFILETRTYVEAELEKRYGMKDPEVKFDIVAHSMGGLLTRYFLRYGATPLPEDGSLPELTWAGAEYVERAILIGTPNAGSAEAVSQLTEGVRLAPVLLPEYPPAVLGTMPSIYQLMPRVRHGAVVDTDDPSRRIDPLELSVWERLGWGLADPDQADVLEELLPGVTDPVARRHIALDHLQKSLDRARQFSEALDRPAAPPPGLSLFLYAGDAEDTPAVLAVDSDTGDVAVVVTGPGDGRVLRTSALLDERVGGQYTPRLETPISWERVTFLFTDHLEMTRDPGFVDNVLYLLLEEPPG